MISSTGRSSPLPRETFSDRHRSQRSSRQLEPERHGNSGERFPGASEEAAEGFWSEHVFTSVIFEGHQLPGGLFVIGKPHDYHMDGPLPRLPSYESVRKKDRQRRIHGMIAQRFGLDGEVRNVLRGTARPKSPQHFWSMKEWRAAGLWQIKVHHFPQNSWFL